MADAPKSASRNSIGETTERELIRRLTSYIEASSLSNTDHWRLSKLRREAGAYLLTHAPVSERGEPIGWAIYEEGSSELIDLTLYKPDTHPGLRYEPLYERNSDG